MEVIIIPYIPSNKYKGTLPSDRQIETFAELLPYSVKPQSVSFEDMDRIEKEHKEFIEAQKKMKKSKSHLAK